MIQHNSADRVGEAKLRKKDKSLDKEFEPMHHTDSFPEDLHIGIKLEDVKYDGQQHTTSFKDNFWEKLTNLRFRFNDGDLFGKYVAYPDV